MGVEPLLYLLYKYYIILIINNLILLYLMKKIKIKLKAKSKKKKKKGIPTSHKQKQYNKLFKELTPEEKQLELRRKQIVKV